MRGGVSEVYNVKSFARNARVRSIGGKEEDMFCRKCGTELPSDAQFCPNCGEKIAVRPSMRPNVNPAQYSRGSSDAVPGGPAAAPSGQVVPPGASPMAPGGSERTHFPVAVNNMNQRDDANAPGRVLPNGVNPTLVRMAKKANTGAIQIAEGVISVVLALMVLFAPVVRVSVYFTEGNMSMVDIVLNLSRFSDYLGKYAAVGPVLGFFMLFACAASILNAKQAFTNKLPQPKEILKGVKISNAFSSTVTIYSIMLIILLSYVSGQSYGVVSASGWAWFLLFSGIACQIVHFVRFALNAPRSIHS